jgi:redox-sensitive bicupin YhaK (pirin superfamily)
MNKGVLTRDFLIALQGSVYVNKEKDAEKHAAYNTLVLSSSANETGVAIEAAEDETEVVLISGEPLDQEVFQYGPFGE